jgi:protein phosphatase 1 regulatory subunit 11
VWWIVCCIYHAPKGIDESSDESSSDSDDSKSDSGDDGSARPAAKGRKECGGPGHHHDHGHGKGKGKGRKRSPNAYEKMPKPKTGEMKGTG